MSTYKKRFIVNGKAHNLAIEDEMPLLWLLRDTLGLTGTKYGCGIGICGSCLVLIDEEPFHSCTVSSGFAAGKKIVTIEGIFKDDYSPVQQAWIEEQVPQCGYCQSGQIIAATALLIKHPDPTPEQIDKAMSSVLCRCGTYQRVKRAIHRAINNSKAK